MTKRANDWDGFTLQREILQSREASTHASTWTEYLCVRNTGPGIALVEICKYDVLCENWSSWDDDGNFLGLPDTYDGKKVVGVEEGYLIGGDLLCDEEWPYREADIEGTVESIREWGFTVSDEMVADLRKALQPAMIGRELQEQAMTNERHLPTGGHYKEIPKALQIKREDYPDEESYLEALDYAKHRLQGISHPRGSKAPPDK